MTSARFALITLMLSAFAAADVVAADVVTADVIEADPLQPLRVLVGRWRTAGPSPVQLDFKLVAANSTLVETYTTASGKETLTVFHADGARLLATHYCGQGNQPRLALTSRDPRALVFEFRDATNLASPKHAHLHRLELRLTDSRTLTMIETYSDDGVEDVSTLVFNRR